jgi:hypothetical protein
MSVQLLSFELFAVREDLSMTEAFYERDYPFKRRL